MSATADARSQRSSDYRAAAITNFVKATIDGKTLKHDRLAIQSQGNVWLAAHQSNVICRNAEAVCRDTISSYPQEISQLSNE